MEVKQKITGDASPVEIIVVGNELLNGTTLDTNSQWLCKKLVKLGALVTRKTTVTDNLKEISSAFSSSIMRSPIWIFSLGGLGPTFDDMTLAGLAKSLKRKVEVDMEALKMVKMSRKRRATEGAKIPRRLSPSILKMAQLPRGASPLRNPVGTAPGVLIRLFKKGRGRSVNIVSLPGVPSEMKAIFKEGISPLLRKELPQLIKHESWLEAWGITETSIAPEISKIMKENSPAIYVKSHPLGFKNGVSLLKFQLSIIAPKNDRNALKILDYATKKMADASRKLGARVFVRKP